MRTTDLPINLGNVIMLFASPAEIERQREELRKNRISTESGIKRRHELAKVLAADPNRLDKSDATAQARALLLDLEAEYGIAGPAIVTGAELLASIAATTAYLDRSAEISRLERRSMRFIDRPPPATPPEVH
jgi:hypothetical protein